MCSKENSTKPQKLISLGADEVISFNAETVNDWSKVLAYLIRSEKQARFVFLPSSPLGGAILGSTHALSFERIGSVADGVEKFNEQGASKLMHPSGRVLQVAAASDKVSLWSIRLNSVPEPFEDSSRLGKTKSLELPKDLGSVGSPSIAGYRRILDLSSTFTLLVGKKHLEDIDSSQRKKVEDLAEKYSGKLLHMSGSVQVIYGPCLAIEVESPLGELPEFQSDLLSLNSSKEPPISRIAKLSAVTPDVERVIEELLKAN